ncbi:MAG TPA: hypothetical protein VFX59_22030 [Polyangiales bacterium]|nr:hypothetical protein [Polyangiales bacterium]
MTATSHSTKSVRTALTDRLRKRFGADATLHAYDVLLAPEAHERLIAYLIDRHAWERLSKTVPVTRDSLIRDFGARGLMNAETAACLELQANFVSQLAKRATDETEVVATKTGVTSSSKR